MGSWPSPLRVILALAAAWLLLLATARAGLLPAALLGTPIILVMGILAATLGRVLRLGGWWTPVLLLAPLVMDRLLRLGLPVWAWPAGLGLLLLVYGGGLRSRVPLYHSSRATWEVLRGLCPEGMLRFADLGAGLGGPLVYLAKARPDGFFLGVEASPLPFALAWLRALPVRGTCKIEFGSLWALDLGGFDVVYAFLSPAPMADLWAKAERQMRPGTLFISNTFPVPGREPEQRLPLPGRKDACLLVYRMP